MYMCDVCIWVFVHVYACVMCSVSMCVWGVFMYVYVWYEMCVLCVMRVCMCMCVCVWKGKEEK